MSRRRSPTDNAPIRRVRIVCAGRPKHGDGHPEEVITVLTINLDHLARGEASAAHELRDDWTGGFVDDPVPHLHYTADRRQVKVRLRCPRPGCVETLEAGPELADWLAAELVAAEKRRVELRELVSRCGTMRSNSRN